MSHILQISEAAALAIHACVIIAGSKEKCTAPHIAEELSASQAHLSKVMRQLVVAGLVESVRGPGGGFVLSRPAAEISLLDIYQAIDGPFPSQTCLFRKRVCGTDNCVLGDFLARTNREARNYFAETTLGCILKHRDACGG
jgi:Rrf2 family protein